MMVKIKLSPEDCETEESKILGINITIYQNKTPKSRFHSIYKKVLGNICVKQANLCFHFCGIGGGDQLYYIEVDKNLETEN